MKQMTYRLWTVMWRFFATVMLMCNFQLGRFHESKDEVSSRSIIKEMMKNFHTTHVVIFSNQTVDSHALVKLLSRNLILAVVNSAELKTITESRTSFNNLFVTTNQNSLEEAKKVISSRDRKTQPKVFYIMNYNQSAKDMFSENVTEEFKEPSTIKIWRFKLNQSKVADLSLRGKPELSELLGGFPTDLADRNFSVYSQLKGCSEAMQSIKTTERIYASLLYLHEYKEDSCRESWYTYKTGHCVFVNAWVSLRKHFGFRSLEIDQPDKADFVINPLTRISAPTIDRYLVPLYKEGFYLVTRDLGRSLQWNSYVKPLSFHVWFCFFALSILLLLAFLVAESNPIEQLKNRRTALSDMVVAFVSLISQQPVSLRESPSLSLLYITAVIFSYVILRTYSAVIMSYITVVTPFSPFNTLEEAISSKTFKFAIQSQVGFETFKNYTDNIRHAMYEKILVYSNETTRGLGTICFGNYFVGMTREHIKYWNFIGRHSYGHCRTGDTYIGPYTTYENTWLTFSNNPYRPVINSGLMKLQESGSLQAFYVMKYQLRGEQDPEESLSEIEMEEVGLLFVILAGGIVLSLLALMMECNARRRSMLQGLKSS